MSRMNSPGPSASPLLPAATLVAAACFLAGALSSASMRAPVPALAPQGATVPIHVAGLDATSTEIAACERAHLRSHWECVREAEGKALIRNAEWVAALEESAVDGASDAVDSARQVIVVRAQRPVAR
jgi:hypothetical protein